MSKVNYCCMGNSFIKPMTVLSGITKPWSAIKPAQDWCWSGRFPGYGAFHVSLCNKLIRGFLCSQASLIWLEILSAGKMFDTEIFSDHFYHCNISSTSQLISNHGFGSQNWFIFPYFNYRSRHKASSKTGQLREKTPQSFRTNKVFCYRK